MNFQQLKKIAAFYGRFTLSFTQVGYRWRKLFWPRVNLDFAGQHWLVTGGSGGLGREMVFAALRGGAGRDLSDRRTRQRCRTANTQCPLASEYSSGVRCTHRRARWWLDGRPMGLQ